MFMRIGLILIFTVVLQLSAADGYSQRLKEPVSMSNVPLEKVLDKIEESSDYVFLYNDKTIQKGRIVSVNSKTGNISEILDDIFKNTDITYTIVNKQIILSVNTAGVSQQEPKSPLRGTVVDAHNEPIIGANVTVVGTSYGTITDIDGRFAFSDVESPVKLKVTYIGYVSQVVSVSGKSVVHIVLKEDAQTLDEVVVVGYGVQKKVNLTGSVSTISAKDINERPVATAAAAIQGADPSINLTFNTGSLDSGYNIDIRGVISVNGGSPLILADGIEVNLNQINPNDIESISVLKDASSAAIYGAKASSGVILITTKSGVAGSKATIGYSGRYGISKNTTSTDFIRNGYDHVSIVNAFYKSHQGKDMLTFTEEEMQMLLDRKNDKSENPDRPWTTVGDDGKYYYYGNFDWYGYLFNRERPQHEHNLSINGGNEKLNYYVSGRYLNQQGMFNIYKDTYENYSFRAKMDAQLNDWLRFSTNINFNNNTYSYAGYYNEQQTLHALQSNINSVFVPRNPDGSVVQYVNQLSANSPLGAGHGGFLTADNARNTRSNKYIILTNRFDASITKDLVLTASYGYKFQNRLYKYRNMPFEYSRQEGVFQQFTSGTIYDYYQENHYNAHDHNANVYATYNNTWNKSHNFTAVLGSQYEDYHVSSLTVKQNDLLSRELSSFSLATGDSDITQSINAFRTLGFFGRLNYDYQGKYLFEATARWDGSSRFSSDDRWGFFPSASAGWRISEEPFWKESLGNFWNNSKIRLSYGSLGNQQVDYYSYIDQIYTDKIMSYTFDGSTKANYASVSSPKSANLTWETVYTYNLGLDFGFFNNRLNFTGDYFIRDTKDMLTQSLTLPDVFGAGTPLENSADLRTKGWEIALSWNDRLSLNGKPFSYSMSASIGDYKTEITRFHNPEKLISDYYEGMTLGEIWGYRVEGLFKTDEEAAAYQAKIDDTAVNGRVYNSKTDNFLRAGDVKFKDLNGDDVISAGSGTVNDPGDKRVIGNKLPRYSYSFRLGANYLGIDVSAFFQGVGKQDWYPTAYAYDFWGPYSFPSLSFIHNDFISDTWTEENPGAYFPRQRGYQSYSGGSLGVVNDRYLQDVSYLRLKNLTIGYTLPISKKIFQSARVYLTGENLFYWSALKKHSKTVDPELTNTSSTYNTGSGVGYAYSKSFSIGIDIKF